MRRVLILVVVLTLVLSTAEQSSAQSFRLHTPSAEEYLSALPDLITQARVVDTSTYQADSRAFQQVIEQELRATYSDLQTVTFDTLYKATAVIPLNPYREGTYSDYGWHHTVLDAWLRENPIDLSTQKQWRFRAYTLDITPVDFSGDGQPELLVEITFQPSDYPDYQELLIMQRDDMAAGKYRQVVLPQLFWYSASCDYYVSCGGGAQTFKLADLNGDGLVEWAVATHQCTHGECGGGLTVLGWRQGEMVNLVREKWPNDLFWTTASGGGGGPALPPNGTWTFSTSDSGNHQVIQRRHFYDNRNCEVTYTTIFTWDKAKDRFVPNDRVTDYADSAPCALRRGQVAMQQGDYQGAVEAYKRASDLLLGSGEPYASEAFQYAQLRLILAYALSGQADKALAIRNRVMAQTPVSETMGHMLEALHIYAGRQDAVRLCAEIRQAVIRFNPYSNDDHTQILVFGQTDDVRFRSSMYTGGDFNPDNTGCDVETVLKPLLDHLPTIPNQSPSAYIASLGLHVSDSFGVDLNNDAEADWLVWLHDLPDDQAVLLLSADKFYRFSMPIMALPSKNAQITVMQLPDGAGTALVILGIGNVEVWNAEYTHPCGEEPPYGSLALVRVRHDSLQQIGIYLLCKPRILPQIIPSLSQVRAWRPTNDNTPAVETIFQWNTADQTYRPPVDSQETTTPYCYNQPYAYCGFDLTNPNALELLKLTLSNPPTTANVSFLATVHYLRAMLLQRQGKPSEALTDFVSVYETSPFTAWKNLAALHLRPNNP